MAAHTPAPIRLLAAVTLTAAAWFAVPAPSAHAHPAQVVVEYGATLEAGAKAADTGKSAGAGAKDAGDRVGDVIDRAKQNSPLFIVGIGALMLTGLWKFVTR